VKTVVVVVVVVHSSITKVGVINVGCCIISFTTFCGDAMLCVLFSSVVDIFV